MNGPRRVRAAALSLCALLPTVAARAAAPASSGLGLGPRVMLESQAGPNAPGGTSGLGVTLRFFDRVDLTAAVGSDLRSYDRNGFALAARGWWLQRGRFSLGAELGSSRQNDFALGRQSYPRPGFSQPDTIDYQWYDAWRANGGLLVRLALSRAWQVQIAAGLGWLLSAPARCDYDGVSGVGSYSGNACGDPEIPEYLQINPRPLRPYGQLTLAYQLPFGAGASSNLDSSDASAAPPPAQVDARIDRAVFAPTARVQKPGTLAMGLELIVIGLSYVLPTRTELALRVLPRLGSEMAASLMAKQAVLHQGRLQLTALAGAGGLSEIYGENHGFWGAGAAAGYCLDDGCESLISIAALAGKYQVTYDQRIRADDALIALAPSVLFALGRHVKLVAELDTTTRNLRKAVLMGALRLHAESFAADLGALVGPDWFFPALSLTWRAL